jgi:hypothetical protein
MLDDMMLGDGEVVAMAVKELPLVWRTAAEGLVQLSEDGACTQRHAETRRDTQRHAEITLSTTGVELTEGKHYWEVEVLFSCICIGISRPNLEPNFNYAKE